MAVKNDSAALNKGTKSKKQSAEIITDFPRGGASGLTPLEYREVSRQAEREVLFTDGVTSKTEKKRRNLDGDDDGEAEVSQSGKSKKNKKGKKFTAAADNAAVPAAGEGEDDIDRVNPVEHLSFKKLTKGAMALGCISAIQDLQLRVSLPGGLIGIAPITSISPELTSMVEAAAAAEEESDDDAMDVDSEDKTDALDLKSRFFVGQFVKCSISELGDPDGDQKKKKSGLATRIELTLMPEEVNSCIDPEDLCQGLILTASVKSVEDHGYVLNAGLSSSGGEMSVFLPNKSAAKWLERWMPGASELKVGQLVEAAVTKVSSDRRSLQVSIDPDVVSQSMVKDTYKTMASVQPGQLVSANVMKTWDQGISLRFMGFYDCSANLQSIGLMDARDKEDVAKKYKLGSTINVRVLYVSLTAAAKIITVSTLPHILAFTPRPKLTGYELPNAVRLATGNEAGSDDACKAAAGAEDDKMWPIPYGTVIDDCRVTNVGDGRGLVLQVPGVDSVRLFVSVNNIVEEGQNAPTLNYHAGSYRFDSLHRARIIGYDAIDAIFRASLRPSIVNESLFSFDDIVPGTLTSGTVKAVGERGVEITLSANIRGFVMNNELSDTKLKHPELIFKVGKTVACRVLKVNVEKRSVLLTCRKSLVNTKLPTVYGYTEAEGAVPGVITMATVHRVVDGGAVVGFYQGISGFVAADGSKTLVAGQTTRCRITSVDPTKGRIYASLNVDKDTNLDDLLANSRPKSAHVEYSTDVTQVLLGDVVSGTVVRIANGYIFVRLDGSNLRASMAIGHLSDHCGALLERIAARTKEGAQISELVVTNVNKKDSRVEVSAKPALIKAAKAAKLTTSIDKVAVGQSLIGWVSNTTAFGVFVAFPGSMSAMASIDMLSDHFVSSPGDLFTKDQTVIASIVSVDTSEEKNKLRVSLKNSVVDLTSKGLLSPADYLRDYFTELEGSSGMSVLDLIGTQTLVSIKQKHPYGLVVAPAANSKVPVESSGFVTVEQAKDRIDQCEEGAVVGAYVLDIDSDKNIVDYSLRNSLVSDAGSMEAILDGSKSGAAANKKAAKALEKAEAKFKAGRKSLKEAVEKKTSTQLVIEIVKEDYLVLSMPLFNNAIAFASTKTYNDISKPFTRFKVGQRLKGTPVRAAGDGKRALVVLELSSQDYLNSVSNKAAIPDEMKRPAIEPVDVAINFFEDYQPGVMTQARVRSIKGGQANLDLAKNIKGRLHISELVDDFTLIESAKNAAEVFAAAGVVQGKTISVKVLGLHNAKAYKILPITHRASPMGAVIDTTIRPSELAAEAAGRVLDVSSRQISPKDIKAGQVFQGFVKNVAEASDEHKASVNVFIGLSLVAHIPILFSTSSYDVATNPQKYFQSGMPIEVQAIESKNEKSTVVIPYGKYSQAISKPLAFVDELVVGARVVTSINSVTPNCLFTSTTIVSPGKNGEAAQIVRVGGRVDKFNITDDLSSLSLAKYTKGDMIDAVIAEVQPGETLELTKLSLSTRPSVVDPENNPLTAVVDPLITSASDVNVGQIIHGYITRVTEVGCFLSIGPGMSARALISELSDEYIRDIKGAFPIGKLVKAVVTDKNTSLNRVSLSLRASRIGGDNAGDSNMRRLDQLNIGETLKGTVNRIEDYGVFIKLDDTFVTGLCYRREIADSEVPVDPKSIYELGDRVLAKVLKVDAAANRVSLGLKASYFSKDSENESEEESEDEDEDSDIDIGSAASDDDEEKDDEADENDDEDDDKDEDEDEDDSDEESEDNASDSDVEMEDVSKPTLNVSRGFQWDEEDGDDADSQDSADGSGSESDDSSDDDDSSKPQQKKNKRSKMQKISQDITAELSEQAPQTASHFERLIVGSPNSSFVWLQFMAFYLSQSEIEQARAIAERALKTISPREEQEKMNIWVALLNLEHRFGQKDTLEAVLKRAVQYMNPKHVYLQLAKIYERADQFAEAEEMHKTAATKFSGSCKVWVLFGLFYLKNNKVTESRDLLARALKSLPKRKHIKAIMQFGQMEFKHGEPERGRTVFEGIMGTYPKRVDLWSVYLDMEVKAVTIHGLDETDESGHCWDTTRNLFERVTSLKHSSKNMKFFFKKWLSFEKAHGTDETIEHVKEKALEYS
ncbi:rRNA biogenesis protein rrp5 [Coemansia sp. Benny D115]|nr:rRNA biogenesis protein rrp5 [Coemansia sp. Benny D115]